LTLNNVIVKNLSSVIDSYYVAGVRARARAREREREREKENAIKKSLVDSLLLALPLKSITHDTSAPFIYVETQANTQEICF